MTQHEINNGPLTADVVVVGGGGAGLPAAAQAYESGARSVIVLEERSSTGGNAVFANGIFACDSPVQRATQVYVDRDELFSQAMAWHHYDRVDARILRAYIDKSGDTIRWLMDKGIEFEVGPQMMMYAGQAPSWHIAINKKTGDLSRFAQVFRLLASEIEAHGGRVLTNTGASRILKDNDGKVCGIIARRKDGSEFEIACRTVIIASGGFIGNKDLLKKYIPSYDDNFGGFFVPVMGHGITLAAQAGGALDDYATLVKETPGSSDEMQERALGMVCREPDIMWVNRLGRRFADETIGAHLQTSTNAILHQPGKVAYALFDHNTIERVRENGWGLPKYPAGDWHLKFSDQLASAAGKGVWAASADTIEGLAEWLGCDAATLRASVDEYNAFCARGHDATFAKQRRHLRPITDGPFHAVKFGVLMIETVGPVRVNENMQVIDAAYQPIPGLYAAGALTSGWQGHDYCGDLMFGSALGYAMNSGRIAGEHAAAYTTTDSQESA